MIRAQDRDESYLFPYNTCDDIGQLDDWRGSYEVYPGTRIYVIAPGGEEFLEFLVSDFERKMLAFIVPFGQDLPKRRIELLQKKLQARNIKLAEDYQQATHLVVSRSVRNMEELAAHLDTTPETLQRHLYHKSVPILLPTWIMHLKSDQSFQHHWPGYYSRAIHQCQGQLVPVLTPSNNVRNVNRNVALAEQLQRLSKAYENASLYEEEQWKALSFHKLAGRLQCLDFEITQDTFSKALPRLKDIPGFGNSVRAVVEDILVNGCCRQIEYLEQDPVRIAVGALSRVHGIGRVQALRLYRGGYDSIEKLRQAVADGRLNLNREQRIGLDCYDDLQEPMKRDEVEKIGKIVMDAFHGVSPTPGDVTIMGSFRRGKESSGDVDILITMKDYSERVPSNLLPRLIQHLNKAGHVAHHITQISNIPDDDASRQGNQASDPMTSHSFKSYMGVFFSPLYPEKRRRVDIKLYPYDQKGFASLYFTGGKWFNRSMRLWATQKFNWKLTDRGLFSINNGRSVLKSAPTEEEIFQKLRLRYKAPPDRVFFDDVEPL